ncbi:pyroglutamyl-peptidase I [Paenibacillus taihuensis]|uniref:Pyrrolidone-carboxylate peptidase n=1 Tax=Paenibacillus taihuensis TaxID=1156355 RepID=A0A3D9SKD4_9BACL|nr:pyroglutamyl-peptidase I [Paenibacillus taihuensis]REE94323.1 pyroglutamyl-peptidase I [Paenibacillus taihuensis]
MKKVLLTGFDPFGGEAVNPSWEAVSQLHQRKLDGIEVEAIELPTVFGKSFQLLQQAVLEFKPDVIICVGQAGGRSDIALERVAVNLDDARIPDNEGNQPTDKPITFDGPAAYWSTLPVKAVAAAMREEGIPASVSYSAGTFVCNHLFYNLQHMIASSSHEMKGGFIHIPYLPAQVAERPGVPSMSLDVMAKAIEIAIKSSV